MKCIGKKIWIPVVVVILLIGFYFFKLRAFPVKEYETAKYADHVHNITFFSDDLAVTNNEINTISFDTKNNLNSLFLVDNNTNDILISENIHKKIYPASLTKMMTFYLAMKYGDLDDVMTVSQEAVNVPIDSSRANLQLGDQLPLKDLLYALMLPSGNDSAVTIAEGISGNVESFVKLMNEEANFLGATNTNFVNPHGYTNENHYTTAYDLYLMLHQCMQYELFQEIVNTPLYRTKVLQANGTYREMEWVQSNYYLNGNAKMPENIDKLGGKTGTTDASGACIALYITDYNNNNYLSVLLGCDTRTTLYDTMTDVLTSLPND